MFSLHGDYFMTNMKERVAFTCAVTIVNILHVFDFFFNTIKYMSQLAILISNNSYRYYD